MGRFLIGIVFSCKISCGGTLFDMGYIKNGEKGQIWFDIKNNKYEKDYKDNKDNKGEKGNDKNNDKNKVRINLGII